MNALLRPLVLAAVVGFPWAAARAEISPAAAVRVLRVNQPAVITVCGTLKMTIRVSVGAAPQQMEIPIECPGTVVDAAGLTAASSLLLDPVGSLIKEPIRLEQQGQTIEIQFLSRLEALHFLLPDKTEVPAKIVIQDDDLHLTLLAPEHAAHPPAAKTPAIRLEPARVPAAFEPFLLVGRTGANFQREPFLHHGVLCAILDKPRQLYLPQVQDVPQFLGLPFFAGDGRFIGLGSIHFRAFKPERMLEALEKMEIIPVIIPAADVRDLVARARQAAPPAAAAKLKIPAAVQPGKPHEK